MSTLWLVFSETVSEEIVFTLTLLDIVDIARSDSNEFICGICKFNVLMIRFKRVWVVNGRKRTAS